jgi:lipid-binding SYLF domain-containing protein
MLFNLVEPFRPVRVFLAASLNHSAWRDRTPSDRAPSPIMGDIAMTGLHRTTAGALMALALLAAPGARAATDEQNLVDRARITLDDVKRDKEFGNTEQLLRRAKAVMIVPSLFKGGFFVGGEGGTGVLLSRTPNGGWSYPAFYTMASASFGLQIGAEESELVLIALSDKAKEAFMRDEFKIGADAGLAVVTLGANAEAATTANLNADIVVWASSSGAYGGLTVNGSIIKPRDSYNEAYYGRAASPMVITAGTGVTNRAADPLRGTLKALSH